MNKASIGSMCLRISNFIKLVDFLCSYHHFFLDILLYVIPGTDGCSQMLLSLHGYVQICACKQPPCFLKELSFHSKVGLACIWMVSKALAVLKEIVVVSWCMVALWLLGYGLLCNY